MKLLIIAALSFRLAFGQIPTPTSHFGHAMGEDRKLLDWSKVVSYFHALEKSSDRVKVSEYGKTVDGKPMLAAIISSPETLKDLPKYLEIQRKLADPRKTNDQEAERLIEQGKAIVLVTCSIHATEVASTSTAVEFAYRLITEDKPKFRTILNDTIFILVPSLNPDGVDIVTDWYRKTLGTAHEGTSPPTLYHRYVGHDNNRDWYIFSQPETRSTIEKLHNVWHPQIVYDVHQQGAFASRMFVPPWMDPVEPNIDPMIVQWCNMMGAGMAADLTSAGKTGVAMNALYDYWSPARHYQSYHGALRLLSESASAKMASPITVKLEDISETALGYDPRQSSWNYLEPWKGGEWHVRDIVDYQLIAMESVLWQAAVRRTDLLRMFYSVGKRAVARTSPAALVISRKQFDPGSAKKMLETLAFGQVEIETATAAFESGGQKVEEGDFIIRMQQPYSSFAKTLLEQQKYPDLRLYPGGPPKRPYDVTAHTLPMLMGVSVTEWKTPVAVRTAKAGNLDFRPEAARPGWLSAANVDSYRLVNEAWTAGQLVWRDTENGDFRTGRTPPGDGKFTPLKQPRLAVFKSHVPQMDEGWTRWILEQFQYRYRSAGVADLQKEDLRKEYDVILFPDQTPASISDGYRKGSMPEAYAGGLGAQGAASLKKFAEDGGIVIFMNHSTEYASKLGIDVKNNVKGLSNREFYSPGSLLYVTLDQSSPLAYGLPKTVPIWSEGSPAWDVQLGGVAQYPTSGVLASGWLLGEKYLVGKSALLDVPMGKGRVILFGMRPQYRAQSYQTLKVLFNAILRF